MQFQQVVRLLKFLVLQAEQVQNPPLSWEATGTCGASVLGAAFGAAALGVAGAALATLIARTSEFLICVCCALRSKRIPFDAAAFFRPGRDMARRFIKYASPVVLNETIWGLGTSLLTVILGYTTNSVDMLSANAVMGNLSRLFLVVCFGIGASTAVTVGKTIGEGKSREEIQDLSRVLMRFSILVGGIIGAIALIFVPLLLPKIIECRSKRWNQVAILGRHVMVIFFLLYFFVSASGGGGLKVFPYHFFWERV